MFRLWQRFISAKRISSTRKTSWSDRTL